MFCTSPLNRVDTYDLTLHLMGGCVVDESLICTATVHVF